jgi:hypothetical protein
LIFRFMHLASVRKSLGALGARTRRGLLSAVCLAGLSAAAPTAFAAPDNEATVDDWVAFDIPAEPLADALNAYGAAAHTQLFVDAELTSGRRSAAVRGRFTLEAALQSLLVGTDLIARPIGDKGFTLVRPSLRDTGTGELCAARSPISPSVLRFIDYSAAVQSAVQARLCRREETRPGTYRTLIRLWIDGSGAVLRAALLTSTGDEQRDAALSSALQALTVGEPPPPGLPQPVTLLLAPGIAPLAGDCLVGQPEQRRADAELGGGGPR